MSYLDKLSADIAKDFQRRAKLMTKPIRLPSLDRLELPMLEIGDTLPDFYDIGPGIHLLWHRPDGTVIGTLEKVFALGESVDVLPIAMSTRYRGGMRIKVSTCFFPLTLQTLSIGLPDVAEVPLLWETAVFQSRPGRTESISHSWRYAGRVAAIAGHRQVVAELRRDRFRAGESALRPKMIRS